MPGLSYSCPQYADSVAALMPRRVAPETYVLADGVALDYDQVADIVGTPSGRPVRYVPESLATKSLF